MLTLSILVNVIHMLHVNVIYYLVNFIFHYKENPINKD